MSKGWDNATLKKLKALTGKGLSTSEIGKRLGMSKNAIVGKLNRLGWNAKAGGAASAEVAEKKTATAKKTATTVKKVAEKKSVVKKGSAKTTKEAVKGVVKGTAKKTESKAKTNKAVAKKEVTTKVEKGAPAAKKSDAKSLAVHQIFKSGVHIHGCPVVETDNRSYQHTAL